MNMGTTYTQESLGEDLVFLGSYAEEIPKEDPQERNPKRERNVASYVGCRLANMPKGAYRGLVESLSDDNPKKKSGLEYLERCSGDVVRFMEVGFVPTTNDEKIATEFCRCLLGLSIGEKDLPMITVNKIPGLKQVEDPFFIDCFRFTLTASCPKYVKGTSFATFYDTILLALKKMIVSGKVLQVNKPRSLVNVREILLYDMTRFAINYLYRDQSQRSCVLRKYPIAERNMRVKGLHNPVRIRSVLTKNEVDTIEMDSQLKTAWDLQTKRSKEIIQGISAGTLLDAKHLTAEANKEFVSAIGKSSLKIAYSRMKKRNTLIASARKAKGQKVSAPKLSYVLSKMKQSNDKYGNPNLIMFSLYRDDFIAVWSRFVSCSIEKDTFVYQWLDKESGIDSFEKVRDWLKANPNLEDDSTSDPEVVEEQ